MSYKKVIRLIQLLIFFLISRTTSIEKNKIVFLTTRGWYDCNPKYIAQQLYEKGLNYTLVWVYQEGAPDDKIPSEIIKVKRGTWEFYKHLASSKLIIDNSVNLIYLGYIKKRNQILVETWHGSLGIKKFSKESNKDKKWVRNATIEGWMTDYCISNSTFETELFAKTFWKHAAILELGHARNDILFEHNKNQRAIARKKVSQYFGLKDDIKLCLYAPTFRDDGDMSPYELDYAKVRGALEKRFGGQWLILTRFHFNILKRLKDYDYSVNTINASQFPDIQELLVCVDIGITDYSSWICDYILTRKPGFLFAPDMSEYETKDREFLYPLNTTPFPVALDMEELLENIVSFDDKEYTYKCDVFLKEKGCIDDGYAAERVINFIENILR